MKVFISGSRYGTTFNKYNEMMMWLKSKNITVLVGDCYGVDSKIQQYCKEYDMNCIVYHIGNRPRNNLGFPTKQINGCKYIDKDIAMTNDCDFGIAIWNGESRGTKSNIERLKQQNKRVIVR